MIPLKVKSLKVCLDLQYTSLSFSRRTGSNIFTNCSKWRLSSFGQDDQTHPLQCLLLSLCFTYKEPDTLLHFIRYCLKVSSVWNQLLIYLITCFVKKIQYMCTNKLLHYIGFVYILSTVMGDIEPSCFLWFLLPYTLQYIYIYTHLPHIRHTHTHTHTRTQSTVPHLNAFSIYSLLPHLTPVSSAC